MRTFTHRYTITAGAMVRRTVRRRLLEAGFTFTEDKSFLDSQFLVTGLTKPQLDALKVWVARISAS